MGMNMGGGGGGGGRRGRRRAAVMAEINVTPMVDVMLVLLIIFMVAAPLMTSTIDIDLPIASGGKSLASNAPPLTLSVKRTGGACNSNIELYLGDTLSRLPNYSLKSRLSGKPVPMPRVLSTCGATRMSAIPI